MTVNHAWTGSGPRFELNWAGRAWICDVAATAPGLWPVDVACGPLLALDGVSTPGRTETALNGNTLEKAEIVQGRLEANYAPEGWGGLRVRAAWTPRADGSIDLETQATASSVGELREFEVYVASRFVDNGGGRRRVWVEPRDSRSAGLSYDGREGDARGWTTLPPLEPSGRFAPRVLPSPWSDAERYVELAHRDDVARRVVFSSRMSSLGHATRYAFFGHDLERGVVVRGRLRAFWLTGADFEARALEELDRFLSEPPPLGP